MWGVFPHFRCKWRRELLSSVHRQGSTRCVFVYYTAFTVFNQWCFYVGDICACVLTCCCFCPVCVVFVIVDSATYLQASASWCLHFLLEHTCLITWLAPPTPSALWTHTLLACTSSLLWGYCILCSHPGYSTYTHSFVTKYSSLVV